MDNKDIEETNNQGVMTFYITKPTHNRYGRIKLIKNFRSVDHLIDNCSIWVKKPMFEKPFICIFENTLSIRGWDSSYGYVGKLKNFPDCEVKDKLRNIALNSIDENFYEKINERYHRWIGSVNTVLSESTTSGNFNLYLTKPFVSSIQSRGIDRADIWLDKPILKKYEENTAFEYEAFQGKSSIKGKYFRKEKHFLLAPLWDAIVNSFDVNDNEDFLYLINENNSKSGQGRNEFLKEYYLNLRLAP